MTRTNIGAQGEVMIFRLDGDVPANAVPFAEKDAQGRPIIAHSESGNHHILDGVVDVMEHPEPPAGMRILYALLTETVSLVQEAGADAHGKHDLAPGLYEFRISREFDPFAEQARQVAD